VHYISLRFVFQRRRRAGMDSLLISPVMSERILVGSNCSFLVDSLLKVVLGSVNSVGEDGLDLLDDGDFVSSKGEK